MLLPRGGGWVAGGYRYFHGCAQQVALISLQQRGGPFKNETNVQTSLDKFVTAVLRTVGDRDRGGDENTFFSKRGALKKKRLGIPPKQSYSFRYALSYIAYPAPCQLCSNLYKYPACSFVTGYFSDAITR